MSTITQPPRPPIPSRRPEPLGNRPLPKGVVGLAQTPAPHGIGARDSAPEGTLIVGRDIQVKGQIDDCRALVVEGRVEATLKADRLEVRPGGTFVGAARVAHAVVAGTFEGTLHAEEQLSVAAGGRVRGEIRYVRIAIEVGGEIGGNVDTAEAAGGEIKQPSLPKLDPNFRQFSYPVRDSSAIRCRCTAM